MRHLIEKSHLPSTGVAMKVHSIASRCFGTFRQMTSSTLRFATYSLLGWEQGRSWTALRGNGGFFVHYFPFFLFWIALLKVLRKRKHGLKPTKKKTIVHIKIVRTVLTRSCSLFSLLHSSLFPWTRVMTPERR